MPTRRALAAIEAVALVVLSVAACGIFGSGTGACVSDPVSFTFGLRVYCYSEWSKDDCSTNQNEQVNGANWSFYEGQTCGDRDLVEGSNPWP